MANAKTPTLLSLDRFAQILGIPPLHFAGGSAGKHAVTGEYIFPYRGACNDRWYQYGWQSSDRISREDLGITIADVEREIAEAVGFYPAPVWITNEVHPYPRDHRRDAIGSAIGTYGTNKSVALDYGKFIQHGPRALTFIGQIAPVYSDEDGDGYIETATVTFNTLLTDVCELKVYFCDVSGAPEWEIRPARTKKIVAGVCTMTFWTWQFILPSLLERFPQESPESPIDTTDTDNLTANVEVYREYTDITEPSARFFYEPTCLTTVCSDCSQTGCAVCEHTYQDGCAYPRDIELGIVALQPSTYDEVNGIWVADSWTGCAEPSIAKVSYYSGDLSRAYLNGSSCEMLSDFWATTIAYMTVARLERPMCSCANLAALNEDLRTDLAFSPEGGGSYFLTRDVLQCPFGTKKGEVLAWRRVAKFIRKRGKVAVI